MNVPGIREALELATVASGSPAGTTDSGSTGNRNLSGLLIQCGSRSDIEAYSLRVSTRGRNIQVQNIPGLALLALCEMATCLGLGLPWGDRELREDIQSIAMAGLQADLLVPVFAFFIPLGYLMLRGEDEITVELVADSIIGASGGARVFGIDGGIEAVETILAYGRSSGNQSSVYTDPLAVFAHRATSSNPAQDRDASDRTDAQATAHVTVGGRMSVVPFAAAWALGAVRGASLGGPRRTVPLYLDGTGGGAGETVETKLLGTDVANWELLSIGHEAQEGRASVQGVIAATEHARRIREFEVAQPNRARAVRHQKRTVASVAWRTLANTWRRS